MQTLLADVAELVRRALRLLPATEGPDWSSTPAAIWRAGELGGRLVAHADLDFIRLDDLKCIDDQKMLLVRNTRQFLQGAPANNALLWGARGTGKSSLIHAVLHNFYEDGLRLIEVDRSSLVRLPEIAMMVREEPYRFIVFCDDLSFEADDASYKALKSALEGSIFRAADNVLIYATSNRRHLLPERMADNLDARFENGELHQSEAVEEKISLSDRFGLWLSFHPFRQDDYLGIAEHWVTRLADRAGITLRWDDDARAEALRWALARGVRSGRTAEHFARHWVGSRLID